MIDPHGSTAARAAAASVADRLGVTSPVCAIVLGSGLAALADRLEGATRANYNAIPGFHAPHVEGHRGELIRGFLGGREVLALSGRFHMYEGHDARVAAFPVRVVHALGAKVLFTSNAAGGVNRAFKPGDLMVIEDHLNLMFRNPLMGAVEPGDTRFPDMSAPYSPRLIALLEESARAAGVPVQKGVYAGLLGPSYETPAEVRMLERLGADATGMSTVPETIVAAAMGMEVAAVSLITNPAAGISMTPLDHAEVVAVGAQAAGRFADLVTAFVQRL
ncbi:MAG: purine-nucleoside phosphorylase [Gemmatimonadetes bacterium]|nr:purine-nucleoside phosphorylase [Gemmatimonadota bacterium]MBI3568077.1 purine-nucleoside phosphorylase [Gemmatimonadota bacterium]